MPSSNDSKDRIMVSLRHFDCRNNLHLTNIYAASLIPFKTFLV